MPLHCELTILALLSHKATERLCKAGYGVYIMRSACPPNFYRTQLSDLLSNFSQAHNTMEHRPEPFQTLDRALGKA
jgi:hypothetical protein